MVKVWFNKKYEHKRGVVRSNIQGVETGEIREGLNWRIQGILGLVNDEGKI